MNSDSITHLNWSNGKKVSARYETIISQYQSIFSKHTPVNKQYWTVCGDCADTNGNLVKGSEPDQMISSKLITPSQFHGVEIDVSRHNRNKNISNFDAQWYNGDLYQTMIECKEFNPSIINFDSLLMPELGAKYFSKIMYMINALKIKNAMLVWNCILKSYCHSSKITDMIGCLEKTPQFQKAYDGRWNFDGKAYVYYGSGEHERSVMGSVIFYTK